MLGVSHDQQPALLQREKLLESLRLSDLSSAAMVSPWASPVHRTEGKE